MIEKFKNQEEVQMVVFKLGSEEYTVPITCVQEIIMPQDATHIPKSPNWVEGVINLRGRIIPIIDGRKKFMMESVEASSDTRIMVLDVEQEVVGLIVDAVEEVVHIETKNIDPAPVDTEQNADFLEGIVKHQERLLIMVNLTKLLSLNEAKDLKGVLNVTESIQEITDSISSK